MRRMATTVVALGILSFCTFLIPKAILAADASAKDNASTKADAGPPADRIVVMYFHRTQRCPTCRRMGSYSEEAVVKGFAQEIKDRTVEFHFIDFQNEANAALTKGYNVSGPTLIVAQIIGNKVKQYKNLNEIWAKNGDKDAFLKYVRDNVTAYQNSKS
jgi:hypothetical protein